MSKKGFAFSIVISVICSVISFFIGFLIPHEPIGAGIETEGSNDPDAKYIGLYMATY